jgi:hypothetical protein
MFRFLDTKVTLRHLLVLGVLVAVPAMGAGALAGGSINGLLPSGTIRMASTSSSSSVSVDSNTVTRVLHVSINIPSGKHGDIQATFAATISHQTGTFAYCSGTITLDSAPPSGKFLPGLQQLLGGATASEPDQVSAAMTGYRTGVSAGAHTVNVYITPAFAGCIVQERALNVLVNIY